MSEDGTGITCQICKAQTHHIGSHLKEHHQGMVTVERYKEQYPAAPLFSKSFEKALEKKRQEAQKPKKNVEVGVATVVTMKKEESDNQPFTTSYGKLHEVYDIGDIKAAKNAMGEPIRCTFFENHKPHILDMVPQKDERYIFDIPSLTAVHPAFEMNMPVLIFGSHGTGKSTMVMQICAHTKRPLIRVQHTVNTEESHICGQWTVKNGETVFEYGPLALAMLNGMTYLADEYDMALPHVLSLYQPVLEGNPLFIKEAPEAMRLVKPHPQFRFAATGNTNGAGDETGLYQGTQIQNAANYSRFKVALRVDYMPQNQELNVIMSQSGVRRPDAKKIVEFGTLIRNAYQDGTISLTISPRELITIAQLGVMFGKRWCHAADLAFINRLNTTDRLAVSDLATRTFGPDKVETEESE